LIAKFESIVIAIKISITDIKSLNTIDFWKGNVFLLFIDQRPLGF